MAKKQTWNFKSCEDMEEKYLKGEFDCDDVTCFTNPMWLDWCERLDDWAPKVALCFNHHTTPVTLDRLSQCDMPEVRRLVCFHKNTSVQTLERLLTDGDRECRESAALYLDKCGGSKNWDKKSHAKNW
ncbi:MAG: HEAT repeat domain-containing protein [candidate division Zixibacteria bacterium]